MGTVSVAEAKAHFSQLIARAAAGEDVAITRRGKLVARLVASERNHETADAGPLRSTGVELGKRPADGGSASAIQPRMPIDWVEMDALTQSMPVQTEPAGDFMRRLRDEARY